MRVTLPDAHMPLTTRVIASILNGWGTFKWKLPVRAPQIVPSGPDGRTTWTTLKRWKHQPDELKHPICDSKHGEICKDGSTLWLYCSQRPRLSEFIQQLWQVLSSYLICKKWVSKTHIFIFGAKIQFFVLERVRPTPKNIPYPSYGSFSGARANFWKVACVVESTLNFGPWSMKLAPDSHFPKMLISLECGLSFEHPAWVF